MFADVAISLSQQRIQDVFNSSLCGIPLFSIKINFLDLDLHNVADLLHPVIGIQHAISYVAQFGKIGDQLLVITQQAHELPRQHNHKQEQAGQQDMSSQWAVVHEANIRQASGG
jgi:hypothetical protein